MDFGSLLIDFPEIVTTSLFCCIVKYFEKDITILKRKNESLTNQALDLMISAGKNILKTISADNPRVFGVLMPSIDNFKLIDQIENYYNIGIRIYNDDGWMVRSPGQIDIINTPIWKNHFYNTTMNVIYTLKGKQRYILILNHAAYYGRTIAAVQGWAIR